MAEVLNTATTDDAAFEAEINRHFRRNFILNGLDITVFMSGYSFISTTSILPIFVSRLTSSPIVIGLIGAILAMGTLVPQILTARWVESLPRKKPAVILTTLLGERLGIFLLTLVVWLTHLLEPSTALFLFFAALTWHSVGVGLVATPWLELMAKVIPVRARGRFFGLGSFGGSALGFLAALAATVILARYPFPTNFAICFSITSVAMALSFLFFLGTAEPARHDPRPPTTARAYWWNLFRLLRSEVNYRRYLLTRITWAFGIMGSGFIAVYAARRFTLPDQVAGTFTAILVTSQMAANLILGELADRRGHKLTLEIASAAVVVSMILAFLGSTPVWLYAAFGFLGIGLAANGLSTMAITMEFSTPEARPTYIALANTISGVAGVVAPLLAGLVAGWAGYRALFAVGLVAGILVFVILRRFVREPRHAALGEGAGEAA